MNNKNLYSGYTVGQGDLMPGDMEMDVDNDDVEFPTAIIVTNLSSKFFDEDSEEHKTFLQLFRRYDSEAEFMFLKSFRRARVTYHSGESSALARVEMHQVEVCGHLINVYFAQPPAKPRAGEEHLAPPPLEKQFLISPPASPPCGWTQVREAPPIKENAKPDNMTGRQHLPVNFELLGAIAGLAPGQTTELHPSKENKPAIVVQTPSDQPLMTAPKMKIPQTRCPSREEIRHKMI